jgi:hypothetical protein
MPQQVEVFDTELPADQNPVLMFQIDVVEAMRREPTRFTYDEADYKKRYKAPKGAAAKKNEAPVDPITSLDTGRDDLAAGDRKLERKRLADAIERITGKRPNNFVSVDELRTTLSQLEPGTLDSRDTDHV